MEGVMDEKENINPNYQVLHFISCCSVVYVVHFQTKDATFGAITNRTGNGEAEICR